MWHPSTTQKCQDALCGQSLTETNLPGAHSAVGLPEPWSEGFAYILQASILAERAGDDGIDVLCLWWGVLRLGGELDDFVVPGASQSGQGFIRVG